MLQASSLDIAFIPFGIRAIDGNER
ncbi:hypothetical protein NB311A_04584 [Nitrobacter sp. Nb-311A]|nr:hypothetical protein NB311A_04584 [Nitrobacter sp. Nb-311A]